MMSEPGFGEDGPSPMNNFTSVTPIMENHRCTGNITKYSDAYQYERAERLGVSQSSIHSALKRLKVTYKKNL